MKNYPQAAELASFIDDHEHFVVVQADNPDVDSLASALTLEEVLSQQSKKVTLYCGVDLPSYLNYVPGWDRVTDELPKQFDASIIVDTASAALLTQLDKSGQLAWLAAKPSVVIDHHGTEPTLKFPKLVLNPPASATCEVIYELAQQLDWPLSQKAREMVAIGIMSDSLGLMSGSTTARTIHIIAELVDGGVELAELDEARRATLRRDPELIHYKGQLLQRVEFYNDDQVALLNIPWDEIEKYSPLYNPPMLVLEDMRLGKNVKVAVVFKVYKDGKITAKIRANYGWPIADKLAEAFNGGGHPYAAGFKLENGPDYDSLKNEVLAKAAELIEEVKPSDD